MARFKGGGAPLRKEEKGLIRVNRTPAEDGVFFDLKIKSRAEPILAFALAKGLVMSSAIKDVLTRMGQLFRTGNPCPVAFSRRERTSAMHM
jgi:hypothetical protein